MMWRIEPKVEGDPHIAQRHTRQVQPHEGHVHGFIIGPAVPVFLHSFSSSKDSSNSRKNGVFYSSNDKR